MDGTMTLLVADNIPFVAGHNYRFPISETEFVIDNGSHVHRTTIDSVMSTENVSAVA